MGAKIRKLRGSWYLVVHANGKRRVEKVGDDLEEAEELARSVNRELAVRARGRLAVDAAGRLSVEDALEQWIELYGPTLSVSTRATARSLIDRHLVPVLGRRDLRVLADADVAELVGSILRAGLSPATAQNAVGVLRRVVRLALEAGAIGRNPIPGASAIVSQARRQAPGGLRAPDAWTPVEVRALLEIAREREPAAFGALLALFSTGIRRGEALGLRWEDVDLERGRLWVRRSRVRGVERPPKGGRVREVALPAALAADLAERARARRLAAPWAPPELVYLSPTGKPWEERNFSRAWERVRRRAHAERGVRPLPLHSARHTVATLHLEAGLSVRWVADQLGHASPKLTLDRYGHVLRDVERDLGHLDWTSAAPAASAARPAPARRRGTLE